MEPAPSPATVLSPEQIEGMLTEAVQSYFSTMLDAEARFIDAVSMAESDEELVTRFGHVTEPMVVAAIGFCGEMDGVAYIYFGEDFARTITMRFLGMTEEEVSESPEYVNDALGELSNMIVGTYKNKLCDQGFDCRLTIPSIVRGSAFSIETSMEVVRHFISYQVLDDAFAIDIIIRKN